VAVRHSNPHRSGSDRFTWDIDTSGDGCRKTGPLLPLLGYSARSRRPGNPPKGISHPAPILQFPCDKADEDAVQRLLVDRARAAARTAHSRAVTRISNR
jgi:hypothetical protein